MFIKSFYGTFLATANLIIIVDIFLHFLKSFFLVKNSFIRNCHWHATDLCVLLFSCNKDLDKDRNIKSEIQYWPNKYILLLQYQNVQLDFWFIKSFFVVQFRRWHWDWSNTLDAVRMKVLIVPIWSNYNFLQLFMFICI